MNAITSLTGRRVWDSRGRPTVEVEVHSGPHTGRAIAPAGASTGSAEAVERRDGGSAFGGRDVRQAVANVDRLIAPALVGLCVDDQQAIDAAIEALDPSPSLATVGANAAVAASLACLHAAAATRGEPLWQSLRGSDDGDVVIPLPEIQIFGGGAHAGRRIDIQDLMVMAPGAASFAEALDWTAEIYRAAGAGRTGSAGVADEGGWWPDFAANEDAIETLAAAVGAAGFVLGRDVVLSLDIAASEFWHDGRYRLALEDRDISTDEMIELVSRWCRDYSIASVEDPLGEHDVDGMRAFTAAMGDRVQVIGDDLYVTNAARVADLADAATAVLVKVNQAGTVTRTRAALDAARANGLGAVVSARSGESEDVSIVHLAVGWGAAQFKVGSITRGERTAKWNEMLRVEESLGRRARFAGWQPLHRPATTSVGGPS
ncbi:phosphopyruvate hydratase [Desertimonas flava]|uniref:phosphopyruvate hydratase n=1 Tax=Desertimonas flava TaxID=2064846 RepID=UPI000E352C23|nr:enolase C-terminal domain-like protein [Desertimonas flava]